MRIHASFHNMEQKIEKKELTWQRLYTVHKSLVFAPIWSLTHQNY